MFSRLFSHVMDTLFPLLFLIFENEVHPSQDQMLHRRFHEPQCLLLILYVGQKMNESHDRKMREPVDHRPVQLLTGNRSGIIPLSHRKEAFLSFLYRFS